VESFSKRKNFEVMSFLHELSTSGGFFFSLNFFVWTAAHGKILTLDNLRKRGVIVVE
jgi:hypothetical protein